MLRLNVATVLNGTRRPVDVVCAGAFRPTGDCCELVIAWDGCAKDVWTCTPGLAAPGVVVE